MICLSFDKYEIELLDESSYKQDPVDKGAKYDLVYQDEESKVFQSTNHGIKIFKDKKIYKSAIICAVGGATRITENSFIIIDEEMLICCADKIFSLSLPDLRLNWSKQVDDATCFRIFKNNRAIFVHGEMNASRINKTGEILWSVGFADILVTPNGKDSFIIHEDFIEIEDWQHNKYKLNFDGEFI